MTILLNGQAIVQLATGDWTTFVVAPGHVLLAAKDGFGYDSQSLDCTAGEVLFFKVSDPGGIAKLPESEGLPLSQSLQFKATQ